MAGQTAPAGTEQGRTKKEGSRLRSWLIAPVRPLWRIYWNFRCHHDQLFFFLRALQLRLRHGRRHRVGVKGGPNAAKLVVSQNSGPASALGVCFLAGANDRWSEIVVAISLPVQGGAKRRKDAIAHDWPVLGSDFVQHVLNVALFQIIN